VTDPKLWWEGGQIYGGLVDYSSRVGDQTHSALIAREIARQAGDTPPYFQPANVQANITNFGQARWALTAVLANEVGFIRDPALVIGYLELAEAVFSQIASRWDMSTCGGGLNTNIFQTAQPSKDIFSVGEFFQLASRLSIKTRNGTYTVWAERIFDWATNVGLLNVSNTGWDVYNAADPTYNCTAIDRTEWSINAGELLYGTALMYNLVSSPHERIIYGRVDFSITDICTILGDQNYGHS
jgi:mannan endo-1,6-alpha-mannosidase